MMNMCWHLFVDIETGPVLQCQLTICTVLLRFCLGYDGFHLV